MLHKFGVDDDLIVRIHKSKNYLIGISLLGQLNYGLLDVKLHGGKYKKEVSEDISKFEDDNSVNLIHKPSGTSKLVSFSHLFNATYDYSCGYYSYLWAEVIALDAYEEFHNAKNEEELKNTAKKFREEVLSKGGSEDPEKLFIAFKGRNFKIDAFLNRITIDKNVK